MSGLEDRHELVDELRVGHGSELREDREPELTQRRTCQP